MLKNNEDRSFLILRYGDYYNNSDIRQYHLSRLLGEDLFSFFAERQLNRLELALMEESQNDNG